MKGKAIFLLVIFLLHILVGFGCSLIMGDMGEVKNHSLTTGMAHEHNNQPHNHADEHNHQINAMQNLSRS